MLRSVLMLSVLALPLAARADDRSDKAAAEKAAKTRSDDRLDALEMKLQALLKEIQSLRSDKGDTAADEAKKALAARRAEAEKAREQALAEAKKALAARMAEEKKAHDKAEGWSEKRVPRVVRIGEDGKAIQLDVDGLKKLGAAELEKLKAAELDLEKLRKHAALELDKLKSAAVTDQDIEKLKKLGAMQAEKLKHAESHLADRVKELAGIELKLQGVDGKRATGEGVTARVEVVPGTTARVVTAPAATTVATVNDPNTVHLTRVTYTLTGEQARALDEFLKAFAKARVLETKIDGDKLVVTTTPDVQATIGQVVGLMTGKPSGGRYMINVGSESGIRALQKGATAPATPKSSAPEPRKGEKSTKPAKPKEKDKDKDDDD